MKSTHAIIIFLLLFLFAPFNQAASQSQTDEEKLKEVESYFQSEFQEEDYYRTDELLITATGSQVPVHLAPSVASVMTADEIEAIGATTLDQILDTMPGIHVIPSGVNFFSSSYSVRGINTKVNPEVLLLINGIPLTRNYSGGRPQTYQMPVSMISRVEMIRGPGSAVYGADAFSGVINVITKDNFEIDGTQTGIRYGSFESSGGWIQHGGQYMGWDLWASLENIKTDGDNGRIVERDRAGSRLALDTRYNFVESHLGLRKGNFTTKLYGTWRNDNGIGPGGIQNITYTNDFDGRELMADVEWRDRKIAANWDLGVHLYTVYMKTDNYIDFNPPGALSIIGNPITEDRYTGVEATAFYEGINAHKMRFSAGKKFFDTDTEAYQNFIYTPGFTPIAYRQATADEIYMLPQNRSLWFFSLQDEWLMAKGWTFTGGIRFDDYSDFGSTINPRAALVWETRYDLTTKLLYGSAFRAPAFSEQYAGNNPQLISKPDIKPETIDTYELAFDYMPTANLRSMLNFFFYRAEDMIDVINTQTDNYTILEGHGFEIDIDWQVLEEFKIKSNLSYQRSKNVVTDSVAHDTPEWQFYLNPHWDFKPDWSLDGQFTWIADRHRAKGDIRNDVPDYGLVNLTLRRKKLAEHWDVALAVRNMFDEDAREPSPYNAAVSEGAYIPGDYPMEGRSFWGELRYKF